MKLLKITISLCLFFICQYSVGESFSVDKENENLRVQVKDIDDYSHASSVGSLIITRNRFSKNIEVRCSAVLIAEDYIMTAAHCVFDHLRAAPVLNIEFIPQYLGKGRQQRTRVFIEEGWIHKQYTLEDYKNVLQFPNGTVSLNNDTQKTDLAILRVMSSKNRKGSGKQFGYIEPVSQDKVLIEQKVPVTLLSYPGDKEGNTLWHQKCELKKYKPFIGQINCRVYSGASGAGVIIETPESTHHVVGIVSTSSMNGEIGEAVLFSNKVIEDINYIISKRPDKVKLFEAVDFKTTKKVYIHIENRCNEKVVAQAYYQPYGSENWGGARKNDSYRILS
ncbi:Trypsin-like peptidase domain [Shewanella psychrophila]|uniref:Trypsin-like peptidase domain n=1 Tax=Shewanella psychrophila TaxID=225848 RepID=A0A1S6HP99_9GAMM|nr:serine protease [Shewanella psychrophila]AQS37347.1 Trypsin-like peptidase domain [Shewanella psychrophila]